MDVLLTRWTGNYLDPDLLAGSDPVTPSSYYSIPSCLLRDKLASRGINLRSHNAFSPSRRADALICIDLPSDRAHLSYLIESRLSSQGKKLLIVMESPIARPELLSLLEFRRWDRVYHYNRKLASAHSLVQYDLPSNLDFLRFCGDEYPQKDQRLIGMMGTNKPSKLSNIKSWPWLKAGSGYQLNVLDALRWLRLEDGLRLRRRYAASLSRLAPNDFSVFGGQWDGSSYAPHHRVIKPRPNSCAMGHSSCNPISIIRGFKFFFATENAIHDDGYMTEKLFNVLRAGSVPIYKPPSDSSLFPLNAPQEDLPFIDLRHFSSGSSLFRTLSSMSRHAYERMIENGRRFMCSNAALAHLPNSYANRLSMDISSFLSGASKSL